MFEHVKEDLLPFEQFIYRLLKYLAIAILLLALAVIPGVMTFHLFFELPLTEAFINAVSLLGSLPTPHPLTSHGGHVFTALYNLFIETTVLLALGTLFSPIVHRILHKMHLNTEQDE
jgi:hypothetical protein